MCFHHTWMKWFKELQAEPQHDQSHARLLALPRKKSMSSRISFFKTITDNHSRIKRTWTLRSQWKSLIFSPQREGTHQTRSSATSRNSHLMSSRIYLTTSITRRFVALFRSLEKAPSRCQLGRPLALTSATVTLTSQFKLISSPIGYPVRTKRNSRNPLKSCSPELHD